MAKEPKPNQINVGLDDAMHDRVLAIAQLTGGSGSGAAFWCVREGLPIVENSLPKAKLTEVRKEVEAKRLQKLKEKERRATTSQKGNKPDPRYGPQSPPSGHTLNDKSK